MMRHKEYTIQTYSEISKIPYGHAKTENLGMDNVFADSGRQIEHLKAKYNKNL